MLRIRVTIDNIGIMTVAVTVVPIRFFQNGRDGRFRRNRGLCRNGVCTGARTFFSECRCEQLAMIVTEDIIVVVRCQWHYCGIRCFVLRHDSKKRRR